MLPITMQDRYYAEIFDSPKLRNDFNANMKIEEIEAKESLEIRSLEQKPEHEEEIDDEEAEFSFACPNPGGSSISVDYGFQNSQIYPLFDRDLLSADNYKGDSKPQKAALPRHPLKKLFFKEHEHEYSSSSQIDQTDSAGTYCMWSGKQGEASPEMSKKSNSTGTSKLWKLREPEIRSNSDGKDAFVFLNPSSSSTKTSNEKAVKSETVRAKGKGGKSETAAAAHERLYVENRATKESDKRRSYLPYRQVGFFTNVNGLSRNIHPL